MIFGSEKTFAIEAMIHAPSVAPSPVLGWMRVWCEGVVFGDFDRPPCALFPIYLRFQDLAGNLPTLWRPEFGTTSEAQICHCLHLLLYDDNDSFPVESSQPTQERGRSWQTLGKFNFLTHWGEPFDDAGNNFILCTPDGCVRILHRSPDGKYSPARCAPLPEVLQTIALFLDWFESVARQLELPFSRSL